MRKPIRFSFSGALHGALLTLPLLCAICWTAGVLRYAVGDPIWVKTPADYTVYKHKERNTAANALGAWLAFGSVCFYVTQRKKRLNAKTGSATNATMG